MNVVTPPISNPNCAGSPSGGTRLNTGVAPLRPPDANITSSTSTVITPICVFGGQANSLKSARGQRATTVGSPTNPGGNLTVRFLSSAPAIPTAKTPFSTLLFISKANVASYGCEPACVSVVPLALLNHASASIKPNPAGVALTVTGSLVLAPPSAPPPPTVTRLGSEIVPSFAGAVTPITKIGSFAPS